MLAPQAGQVTGNRFIGIMVHGILMQRYIKTSIKQVFVQQNSSFSK
jgi:hypothetical protein